MLKFLTQDVEGPVVLKTTGLSFFIFAIILLLLTGCASQQKALQKAQNKVIASGTLSELCAKFFPPNIQFVPGDTVVKIEREYSPGTVSYYVKNDTVFQTINDTIYIRKNVLIHDTLRLESTAKIDAITRDWKAIMDNNGELNNRLLIQKEEVDKYKSQRNTAYLCVAGLAGLIGLSIFLRIKGVL